MQVNSIDAKLNYGKNHSLTATPIKPVSFGHEDESENTNSTTKTLLIGGAVLAAAVAAYFMFRKGKTPNVETPKPTPAPKPNIPEEQAQVLMNTRNDRDVQQMYLLQKYGAPKQAQGQKLLTWNGKIDDYMLGEFSPLQIREGLPQTGKNGVFRPSIIFTSPYELTKTQGKNGNIIESYRYGSNKFPDIVIELDKDGNILSQRQISGNIETLSEFDKSGLMTHKKILEYYGNEPEGKLYRGTEIFDDGIQRSKICTIFDDTRTDQLTFTDSKTKRTILRQNKENSILTGHIKYDSDGNIIEQFNPDTGKIETVAKA